MLTEIEAIKKIRELNAQKTVKRHRMILAQSEQTLKEAEQALTQYCAWRIEEEQRQYQEILGSNIELKGLEKVKHQIGTLRQKEVTFEDKIMQARKERDRAERDLYQAEIALHETRKALEKCQELVKQTARETFAKALRGEEKELEEAAEGLYINRQQLA